MLAFSESSQIFRSVCHFQSQDWTQLKKENTKFLSIACIEKLSSEHLYVIFLFLQSKIVLFSLQMKSDIKDLQVNMVLPRTIHPEIFCRVCLFTITLFHFSFLAALYQSLECYSIFIAIIISQNNQTYYEL